MLVIVAGGGYAGLSAALRLRRKRPDADVLVINDDPRLVERIRLHQLAAGEALPQRPLAALLARAGARFLQGRVRSIDPSGRYVVVAGKRLPYDRLVLALGSTPRDDDLDGVRRHAFTLSPRGAVAVAAPLRTLGREGGRVAVVGSGLCGVEAATEIAAAFPRLHVTWLGAGEPLAGWSDAARQQLRTTCEALGIEVRAGVEVNGITHGELATDAGAVPFDACIWATGFDVPSLPWDACIAVDRAGRVRVDSTLRSVSHPDIYAVGDMAAIEGMPLPQGCKSAMPMGAHAGDNIARELAGERPIAFRYALLFFCVSLGRDAGIVQWPDAQGGLRGRAWTGRRAAWMKELICKSTWWAIAGESRGWPLIAWRQGDGGPLASSAAFAEAAGDD
jgi:NADH dehydrogenase